MLNWLDKQGGHEEQTDKVVRRVERAFPAPQHDNRGERMAHLPHTQHVLERQTTAQDEKMSLLLKEGFSFYLSG